MRKVFTYIGIAAIVYWVIVVAVALLFYNFTGTAHLKYIVTTAIQFFGGIATFSAVIVSLFAVSIRRRYDRPNLRMKCAFDSSHIAISDDVDVLMSSSKRRVMEIFASVLNASLVEANDTQLVCLKAFASEDGDNFVFVRDFRAASFRWLYSSEQNRFLTTMRRSVEKYAKVIEIVETEVITDAESKPDEAGPETKPRKSRQMHFEICLPLNIEGRQAIEIDPKYKVILLSICLASCNSAPMTYCLLVHNKAGSLEVPPSRDDFEIGLLSKEEALEKVAVHID